MFLNLLVSLCCAAPVGDTLDVATVSSRRNAAVAAVAPVRSMSGASVERLGTIGLHEAVTQFSGISVKDYGGVGGLKTVSVRNMGASHTAVVYDGISISDAQNGQTDISMFNLDDISKISVSIGVDDDIFRSAKGMTSAGVLRIDSGTPTFENGPTKIDARLSGGLFGTYTPYISLKQRLGSTYSLKTALNSTFSKGDYPFILHNGMQSTREKRINSDVMSYGAEVDFHADWNRHGRFRAKVNYHGSERGLPGSVILYTQKAFERLWDRSVISNVMYERDFGSRWRLHADAGFTYGYNRHIDTNPIYQTPLESIYSQNEYSLAARALFSPTQRWSIALAEDLYINSLDSNIPDCPFPVRHSSATALSVKYADGAVTATASIVGLFLTESVKNGETPKDRFRLSPMAGVSWYICKGFSLRASVKEGFRVPTFNDLYYSRVGSRNLRPEIALQSNAGVTFSGTYGWGTVDITADGYYNSIKDKIVAVPTMFIWKMRNLGRVEMFGTDLAADVYWKTCGWLRTYFSGNYSLQYALDVTDPSAKNYRHQIPYTPRHCGSGSITFETHWLSLTYRMHAAGKRYSLNQNIPANEIEEYADHCMCVSRWFTFRNGCKAYVGAEGLNLAGHNYEIIHYYPMPGRSFRITLKFKY